jgi:catechol 2,3-dioxygenase-like lactoylglutathione lyase family enzyme
MGFSGIDAVVFGVADMAEAKRFLDDWGTRPVAVEADRLVYETRDGGQVIVRPQDAPDLPPAIEPGNTVREVIWGAADEAELRQGLERLQQGGALATGPDGLPRVRDPNGLSLAFRVSQRHKVVVTPTPANAPGTPQRVDRRSPVYDHAEPIKIGHVVLFASDYAAMRAFYTERMGFVVSDEYPGHGAFLRCQPRGEHHNLFVLNRPGRPGVNHVAFTVTDIHEVIGGGLAMSRKGWKTEIGPGRHPISSAYFWYFHNPLGAPVEYYADDDFCTEAWQAETFQRSPELFAEWAIAGGIDGTTRRQVVAVDDSGRGHA